jgi:hypothetical protein
MAAEFTKLKDANDSLLETLRSEVAAGLSATQEQIKGVKVGAEADIEKLRASLRSELRLQAPASYWLTKAASHNKAMLFGLGAFTLSTIALIVIVLYWGGDIINGLPKDKDGNLFLGEIVVLTIPALGYFWFMRYLGRFFVINHAAAADSRLRVTMTQTFLALAADGRSGLGDAERLIILQALFRPHADSGTEDAPPPNLLEIMGKIVRNLRRSRTLRQV